MADNAIVVSPEFRMVFPNLFEPKAIKINGKPTGEPRYDLTMLFEPGPDFDTLKTAAVGVAKAKWPNRDLKELRFPFKGGDTMAAKSASRGKDGDFYKGKIVLSASSKFKPGVVDANKQDILDTSKVYSGCWGYAELNFVAYDGVSGGQDGVKAYVNFVMKSRDDDRIAGRDAKSVFAGIQGGQTDYDPSAGLDDEIAF